MNTLTVTPSVGTRIHAVNADAPITRKPDGSISSRALCGLRRVDGFTVLDESFGEALNDKPVCRKCELEFLLAGAQSDTEREELTLAFRRGEKLAA